MFYNSSACRCRRRAAYGSPIFSNFTVMPVPSDGSYPSCDLHQLPVSSTIGTVATVPACTGSSTAVKFGDDIAADQTYSNEGGLGGPYNDWYILYFGSTSGSRRSQQAPAL